MFSGFRKSCLFNKILLKTDASHRVATQPGKPGEPGRVREFDI